MTSLLRLVVSIASLLLFARQCVSADDLPKRLNFDRYSAMLNRSPFAIATAVAMPAATPNFAKDLYVANAARTRGEDLVTVQSSSDKGLKEYLSTKSTNANGYAIANIEWSERPGATKVTISKDGQFATLTFNQALMVGPPSPPGSMPQPPQPAGVAGIIQPAVPTPAPNYVPRKPANVPGYPRPSPHVRGVIQRNPNVPAPPKPTVSDESEEE